MAKYVLGFAFSPNGDRVALIKKNRPAWQRGLFNGIGGKVEEGEVPRDAMVREFGEEAGATTVPTDWRAFGTLEAPDASNMTIYCYYTKNVNFAEINTRMTDEEIHFVSVSNIQNLAMRMFIVPNLTWLIPLALDEHNHVFVGATFGLR